MITAERLTLNPLTEDSTLAPLDLVGLDPSWGIYVTAHDYPTPKPEVQRAGGGDTEGEPVVSTRYGNRTLSVRLRLVEPEDAAATNRATNPVAGLNTTGWASTGAGAVNRVTIPDNAPQGKGIETAIDHTLNPSGTYLYHEVSVQNAKTYRFSMWVQKRAGVGGKGQLVVYNAAGAVKKATGATVLETTNTTIDGWVRLDVSFTADATATWRVGIEMTTGTSLRVYATGVLVEESASLGNFFCGDTPGCDWSGARHGSMATRPAPGGVRFSRIYRDVMMQLDRLKREKVGTYRRIPPNFGMTTYDTLGVEVTEAPADISLGMRRAEIALSFEAKPGGRRAEVFVGTFEETSLPVLTFLAENIPGDMPALGRLQLQDQQAQQQNAAWWGLQQLYYSSAAEAGLFYQAEALTPLGSAATAALAGASGSGNNTVLNNSLVSAYGGVLSTQLSGGGAHLANVGSYRVLARLSRPTANEGEVSVKLAWSDGDFVNVTENDPITFGVDDREGVFTIEDLGIVTLSKAKAGATQRWEGRILAKSTRAGDDVYVDWIWLIPVDEGSGQVIANTEPPPPSSFVAYDSFLQTAGALAGKVAGIGGTWAGAGDADDFAVTGATTCRRVAVSDVTGTGRYATLGSTKYTNIAQRCEIQSTNPAFTGLINMGMIARYVDVNNWFGAGIYLAGIGGSLPTLYNIYSLWVWKKVAGTKTLLAAVGIPGLSIPQVQMFGVDLQLMVLSNGEWRVGATSEFWETGTAPWLRSGTDADLSSTGALKEGLIGLWDEYTSATANERYYDNFEAWVPSVDSAIYASRALEITDRNVRRQDSAGVVWGDAAYEGEYLLVPHAGNEKRISRITCKGSRNPESDSGIDDLRAQLWVTPRDLVAPPT